MVDSARLATLATVAGHWLEKPGPLRATAVPALQVSTGYSKVQIEQALDAVFAELTFEKLKAYRTALSTQKTPIKSLTILHIAAGNVFTAWLHGAVISLLLGHRILIKPSAQEPVFAMLWKKSVAEINPELANAIEIVAWHDSLVADVGAVVVYGNDETLQYFKGKCGAIPFVGYGYKFSAAIIFQASAASAAEAARQDIEAFNLEGCLSPQMFYIEKDTAAIAQNIRTLLPRSRLPEWKAFQSLDDVWRELDVAQPHLSCVGVAGTMEHYEKVAAHWQAIPAVRVCALGDMQRPPLNWLNGGINLGEFLLKC